MSTPNAPIATAVNVDAPESPVNATTPSGFVDLDDRELDALMSRIAEAREHGMALSAGDYDLLASAVMTLASLQERLSHSDLTILKLKKLLGMVNASESLKNHPGNNGKSGKNAQGTDGSAGADGQPDTGRPVSAGRKNPRRKKPKKPPLKPTVHHHGIEGLNKGDTCPGCRAGIVYKYHPATLLRIVGHAPFSAEQHVSEQLRCSACHEIFTAELPVEVRADGRADQTYGYSARALMGIARYFAAQPFHRQEAMQNLLGSHISASTIYDQCEKLAEHLKPVFVAMLALAANARLFYLDDTTHRILIKQTPPGKTRKQARSARTGVYSSACLAILPQGNTTGGATDPPVTPIERRLVLYRTSVGHAGEWFDEILDRRDPALDAPTLMSDALSSNHVTSKSFVKSLCNAHGRRGFAELAHQSPDESLYALERYAGIWRNEGHGVDQGFDAEQRQAYHQRHSLPLMAELKSWCERQTERNGRVEPNSNLGRAMAYFVRHYEGLTAFCAVPGAPIDNNECERMVKLIVRGRKNSQFFKSENGAEVSDVITSVLATCHEANIDAMAYLTAIQANQLAVRAAPQNWMPWNYPGSQ